jgi:hypothetical protein
MNARILGQQHRVARGLLRVGQIAEKSAGLIGSVGGDKQGIGQIAMRGLKGFSTLAPKLASLAERAGDIKSAGGELRDAFQKRDIVAGLGAGKRLAEIGQAAFKTKKGDLALKESKKAAVAAPPQMSTMPVPRPSQGFGDAGF